MRHRKAGLKLSRTSSHRDAMFRNMVTSLFKYERITTTDAKAKEIRRWADKLITLAKRGDLHARRQAMAIMREKEIVHILFDKFAKKYEVKAGGYTRLVKIGYRTGDAAPMSLVELIDDTQERPKKKKAKKTEVKEATPVEAPAPKTEESAEPVEETAKAETAEVTEEAEATETVEASAGTKEKEEDAGAAEPSETTDTIEEDKKD